MRLLQRGSVESPGPRVEPGLLTILSAPGKTDIARPSDTVGPTSGYRLALAHWLTDQNHPLTARVIVNRVWQHHFGTGIVATPENFGRMGAPPTHPELLDWLAVNFMENGWTFKRLHRMIMTSTTYRQMSLQPSDGQTSQGSRCAATLGFTPQYRWGWKAVAIGDMRSLATFKRPTSSQLPLSRVNDHLLLCELPSDLIREGKVLPEPVKVCSYFSVRKSAAGW